MNRTQRRSGATNSGKRYRLRVQAKVLTIQVPGEVHDAICELLILKDSLAIDADECFARIAELGRPYCPDISTLGQDETVFVRNPKIQVLTSH